MRRYLKSVLLVWLAVAFVASLSYAWPTKGDLVKIAQEYITQITPKELNAELSEAKAGKLVILDVREPSEYKAGHIPYAKNLPRGLLEFKIAKLVPDKSTPIVVYCRSGGRGSLATLRLMTMGYGNVKNLEKGFIFGWKKAGYKVEK